MLGSPARSHRYQTAVVTVPSPGSCAWPGLVVAERSLNNPASDAPMAMALKNCVCCLFFMIIRNNSLPLIGRSKDRIATQKALSQYGFRTVDRLKPRRADEARVVERETQKTNRTAPWSSRCAQAF